MAGFRPGWIRPPRLSSLDLLEQACGQGWTVRAVCRVLEVSELRVYRWLGRRAADQLEDHTPGGSPMHGLLEGEVAEIVRLFDQPPRSGWRCAGAPGGRQRGRLPFSALGWPSGGRTWAAELDPQPYHPRRH